MLSTWAGRLDNHLNLGVSQVCGALRFLVLSLSREYSWRGVGAGRGGPKDPVQGAGTSREWDSSYLSALNVTGDLPKGKGWMKAVPPQPSDRGDLSPWTWRNLMNYRE